MSDVNKRIVVDGDASGFENLIEQLGRRSEELYDNLSGSAKDYANSLDKQREKMDDLIRKEDQFISRLREEKRLQVEARFEQKMASLETYERTGHKGRVLERERADAMRDLNKEYRENKFVLDDIKDKRRDDSYFDKKETGGGGFNLGGIGGSIAKGLGFGAILGIGSIISNLISTGQQFGETRAQSRAMFGSTFGGATDLGMSELEFTPSSIRASQMRGRRISAYGQVAAENAFGLGRGGLDVFQQDARNTGVDVEKQLANFLNIANNSKTMEY